MLKRKPGIIFLLVVILLAGCPELIAQTGGNTRRVEKRMAGNKRKAPKEAKIKQPKAVTKAQRAQKKKQDKRDKDYSKAVKGNKSRHYSIQTNDVKERMKQNEKDLKLREKEKRIAERKRNRQKDSAKKRFKRR